MVKLLPDISQLRRIRLQELAPHRYVIEQVLDLEIGADGTLAGFLTHHFAARYLNQRSYLAVFRACHHLHMRYGTDTGQRFPSKTHRMQRKQVLGLPDLTRGVSFKGHAGIHRTHTAAVIDHLQQRPPGIDNDNTDMLRTRIQTVLHQLLKARGGALNHLAGSYLISYTVRKKMDNVHTQLR